MDSNTRDIQDFVYYLTHSKSLTRIQQLRRDKLLVRDLFASSHSKSSTTDGNQNAQPNSRICVFHSPIKIVEFLHKFTDNNSALKYTTHFWDKDSEGKYAYSGLLQDAGEKDGEKVDKFKAFTSKYKYEIEGDDFYHEGLYSTSQHLWNIVTRFLLDEETRPWSEFNLKIGYNKYLKSWMDDNPDMQPASMPISAFPRETQPQDLIRGKVLSYFSDVIDIFKRCIEFRDNDLYIAIRRIFISSDHRIDGTAINSLKGRAIYTDTEYVKDALRIIAGNILQRSMYPDIKISCQLDEINEHKVLQLKILQVGSFSNRDVGDDKIKANSEMGDFHKIKEKLTNLCDFAVESTFRVGNELKHCRINYLSSDKNEKDIVFIDDKECEGFTYILSFYTE